MRKLWILFLIFFTQFFHLAFAAPIVCDGKPVLGKIEKVILLDYNLQLDAKLDTGAAMTSLSATDISVFQRDHQDWVRFTFQAPTTKMILTKPLIKYIHILKRHEEGIEHEDKQYGKRVVVPFLICIGDQQKVVHVNLVDRSKFHYPILLGRSTLREFHVLVDVSQKYIALPKCIKTKENITT